MTEPTKRILVRPIGKAQPWAHEVEGGYCVHWHKASRNNYSLSASGTFYSTAEFAEMFDVVGEGEE